MIKQNAASFGRRRFCCVPSMDRRLGGESLLSDLMAKD